MDYTFFLSVLLFSGSIITSFANTHYVSASGVHIAPFTNWITAATNIQSAIDVAETGSTVLVSNGIYVLSEEINIHTNIELRSVNGPENTIVDADGNSRCIRVDYRASAIIDGFTITGGYVYQRPGGGVYCESLSLETTIKRCIITGNTAINGDGGGVDGGQIENCIISGNYSYNGGGVYMSPGTSLRSCLIYSNTAYGYGGGGVWGGGVLENSTIVNNTATNHGGGIVLYHNDSNIIINCIIYNNISNNGSNYYIREEGPRMHNCCTVPLPTHGTNNIDQVPGFITQAGYPLHLTSGSPCIDQGSNLEWCVASKDIDDQPRVFNNTIDIGADEAVVQCKSTYMTSENYMISWDCIPGAHCEIECCTNFPNQTWSSCGMSLTCETFSVSTSCVIFSSYNPVCYRLRWSK